MPGAHKTWSKFCFFSAVMIASLSIYGGVANAQLNRGAVDRPINPGIGLHSNPINPEPNTLLSGAQLVRGQSLHSLNGKYTLILQFDGNLVLYQNGSRPLPLWASNTVNTQVVNAAMQKDGNLVVNMEYLAHEGKTPKTVVETVWASATRNNPGAFLALQDDGNLVIYEYTEGLHYKALWGTNTNDDGTGCYYGVGAPLRPYGLIGAAWRGLEAADASKPLGCPVGPEMNYSAGPGRTQSFQFGQISWSPNQGNTAMLIAYQAGSSVEMLWAGVDPYGYDFWIARTDVNGSNVDQQDVKTQRDSGWFVYRSQYAPPGQITSFVVEGCDESSPLGEGGDSHCRQSFFNRVSVPMQANPNKKQPTLPDPAKRGTSCFLTPSCVEDGITKVAQTISAVVGAIKSIAGKSGGN